MITTSVTWNITDLARHDSDGFVYEIKYSIAGISTETVGSASTTFEHVITGGYMVPDQTRTGNDPNKIIAGSSATLPASLTASDYNSTSTSTNYRGLQFYCIYDNS